MDLIVRGQGPAFNIVTCKELVVKSGKLPKFKLCGVIRWARRCPGTANKNTSVTSSAGLTVLTELCMRHPPPEGTYLVEAGQSRYPEEILRPKFIISLQDVKLKDNELFNKLAEFLRMRT